MIAFAARPDPVGNFIAANPWVIPLFMVGVWWLSLQLVARVSGWSLLAERYRAEMPFEGQKWRFQSAQMRYMSHYNGCLTVGANMQGLYLATWFLFRIAHQPLFIPWNDLTMTPKRRWLFPGYELRFNQVSGVFIWIQKSLGDRLQAASKSTFGYATVPPIG
jgi:hypothetical protein